MLAGLVSQHSGLKLCVTKVFFKAVWASVNVYHTEAFTLDPVFWMAG